MLNLRNILILVAASMIIDSAWAQLTCQSDFNNPAMSQVFDNYTVYGPQPYTPQYQSSLTVVSAGSQCQVNACCYNTGAQGAMSEGCACQWTVGSASNSFRCQLNSSLQTC